MVNEKRGKKTATRGGPGEGEKGRAKDIKPGRGQSSFEEGESHAIV